MLSKCDGFKDMRKPKKACPLLVREGVFKPKNITGRDHEWIEKICFGICPFKDDDSRCVYEKEGRITEEDKILLEGVEIEEE